MFWKCEKLDDSKSIIINNEIIYNGHSFNVKYVYENAFYNNLQKSKKIIIDDKVLGFCNSSGDLVENLNGVFKNETELESIDFGNAIFVFGEKCFENCKGIVNVEIPNDMNNMEGYCFK